MSNLLFDIDKLKLISNYSIEYGILTEDGVKTIEVSILNTDNTINKTKMEVKNAMYFIENGTLMLPGTHFFDNLSITIDNLINNTLDKLLTNIFINDISEMEIDTAFQMLANEITTQLQLGYENSISNINKLNTILGIIVNNLSSLLPKIVFNLLIFDIEFS